ncbi:MAG: hypothetical protein CVT84_15120 [Alphaproteobacteria bacterium HGW-Alphaproteobacteria-6]|nr:MAG: hypothetical protein CVT84_15120 [Alphaproteobacteria bacterium HGW-Alphaproteobacteria-6]
MSALTLMVVFGVLALVPVALPLLARETRALGRGLEDDSPLRRWEAEKARLITQLQDNDLALAEDRVDAPAHAAIAARLGHEAEAAVATLRRLRAEFGTPPPETAMRPGIMGSAAALLSVLGLALGAQHLARWQDIDLAGSPHADGRVALDASAPTPAETPVIGPDGAPDIGAMVARLEGRVADGDASAEDIKMLLRSYDTMGRQDEARDVLEAALARWPDDSDFQIGWLRAQIAAPDTLDPATALPVAERLIAALPDLAEARWYRSLLLVRLGRAEDARHELMWLAPRLPEGSPAAQAVAGLLAEIDAGTGK